MNIKKYRPVTPSSRYKTTLISDEITDKKSDGHKSLLLSLKRSSGRGVIGNITTRHKGGRSKRKYRIIDFHRYNKTGIEGTVVSIEYDPNRTSNIALIKFIDGDYKYVIASIDMKVGMKILSNDKCHISIGNNMCMQFIPLGIPIHNIELHIKGGGIIARSAGAFGTIVSRDKGKVHVQLPSGVRYILSDQCRATVGIVGNKEHNSVCLGKAGRNRYRGVRPTVRGVAMNPVDHPLGGGEGRSSGGRHPVSKWGVPEKKTRNRKKKSTKYIIKDSK